MYQLPKDSVNRIYEKRKEEFVASHPTLPLAPIETNVCLNCWDLLQTEWIESVLLDIHHTVESNREESESKNYFKLIVDFPPFLDIPRILFRTYMTNNPNKTVNFPTLDVIFHKIVSRSLLHRFNYCITGESDQIIHVQLKVEQEKEIFDAVFKSLSQAASGESSKKRKLSNLKMDDQPLMRGEVGECRESFPFPFRCLIAPPD